ncbi:Fructose-1,6-bisphosphatase, cytosolic [Galdieria sulphuraria]|nr:Fructose-1,6-bisphosphatase, cytosolic [Galdieria sulphuraria]
MSQHTKVAPPTGLEETDSVTLTRFVLHEQRKHPESQGDLTLLLTSVQLACKVTDSCVRKAGIAKLYGLAGGGNVSGDLQQKLDVISNETFKVNIESSQKVAVMVSEEEELPIVVEKHNRGKYGIAFDPLDGSSNIDSNVTIGSIFSIFHLPDAENIQTTEDAARQIMQPGRKIVAAGYAMYGSATNLVLSFGNGVHGFTLDPSLGEFVLTHPNIRIPRRGKIYSVNEGNCKNWDKSVTQYIHSLKFPSEDVHRTLLYGGIFCYPADKKNPNGKLRLLYEGAPMAFLMEQAGGKASTGTENILDIQPHSIHQRTPVFMGSYEDVCDLESFCKSAS